jgi:tripartite-type tricarboxylate transporter receptor subunit TctC
VNAFWIATSVALPHIKAGKVRALAVGERARTELLPDVPTMQEAGVADYEYSPWLTLYAPSGTPDPVIKQLRTEVTEIVQTKAVVSRLKEQGLVVRITTPEEQRKLEETEGSQMKGVIASLGMVK